MPTFCIYLERKKDGATKTLMHVNASNEDSAIAYVKKHYSDLLAKHASSDCQVCAEQQSN